MTAYMIENNNAHRIEDSYVEKCSKCAGTGNFRSYMGRVVGQCFACKGVGHKTYKTDSQTRAANRAKSTDRRSRNRQENLDSFRQFQPAAAAWIETAAAGGFDFAKSLAEAIAKYGDLTEKQLAVVERCIVKDAERNAQRAANAEEAPAVDATKLHAAFDAAAAAGLKYPKMRFEGFAISPAPAHGRNAGALYVKDGDDYLGKISGGRFFASRDCDAERAQSVADVVSNPTAAAVAFGKKTGSCCCCGRELTNPASVEAGIGPICAENWGL
jgi:hypothetical protein